MARPRAKRRTHAAAKPTTAHAGSKPGDRPPKSIVIRIGAGEVGPSVSQLVKDMRMVLQPDTAIRLKERKNNKLRDYTTMTGPLGVTHLFLFSKSTSGNTNLRIAITPRGPTLNFRVENYSLMKDIMQSQKHAKDSQVLYLKAPLLVMNNFSSSAATSSSAVPKHLEQLVTTVFQSVFPPLNPQTTPLSSIKRVLLLNREPPLDSKADAVDANAEAGTYTVTLRHYAISTKPVGLPKAIKRLQAAEKASHARTERHGKGVPNLGRLADVADWMLDPAGSGGYTSASESEPDTEAEVEVLTPTARKLGGAGEKRTRRDDRPGVERRGIKLTELGPRMRLRLIKVEEGLAAGRVMWHEYIRKSREEEREMDRVWEARRRAKEERKRVQRENLERKKEAKGRRGTTDGKGQEGEEDEDFSGWDSDMLDAVDGAEESGDEVEDMEDVEEG